MLDDKFNFFKMNNLELINLVNLGKRVKYLFFWGHTPKSDLYVDKSCFSQWFSSQFFEEGHSFKTAEHWMMYKKACLFGDDIIGSQILDCETPGEAKDLGRKVNNFIAEVWDEKKYGIVVKGNALKFAQNEKLKEFLIKTKDRILVEASPVDKIWGIGMAMDNSKIEDPSSWEGENLLGYALMEVRERLRK